MAEENTTEQAALPVETPTVAGAYRDTTTHAYISRIKQREPNLFVEEYYSSTDVKVYFDDVEQTEIGYIQYSIQEQLKPLFGYASRTWDDVAIGNRIVTGVLKIPIRNIEVRNYGDKLNNPAFGEANEIIAYQGSVKAFDAAAYNEQETKKLEEQEWTNTSTPGGSATTGGMSIGDLRQDEYEEANKKLREELNAEKEVFGPFLPEYTNTRKSNYTQTPASDAYINMIKYARQQGQLAKLSEEEKERLAKEQAEQLVYDIIKQENKDKNKPTLQLTPKPEHIEQKPSTPTEPVITSEPEDADMVLIKDYIPDIVVDLKYATTDNFTGQVVYEDFNEPYLRYGTVKKLMAAQEEAKRLGFGLKIWDAYRPHSAQISLWEKSNHDPNYVANPYSGFSNHTRGCTIDVTLVDSNGREVQMPTSFDWFGDASEANSKINQQGKPITTTELVNRTTLQKIMTKSGFTIYDKEWWHFNDSDISQYWSIDDTIPGLDDRWQINK